MGLNDLLYCECETKFSIEKHGENYVLYLGRCNHKHGYNLFTISDVAHNCDLKSIENKLNEKQCRLFDNKMEKMRMLSELKRTGRGFRYYEFEDRNGYLCQLQKSSVATEECIWLGLESASPKKFVKNEGWLDFELPEGVETNTRMHLTREQAGILAKQLEYFSNVGELPHFPYG